MSAALKVDGVTCDYGGYRAVDGASFSVTPNHTIGLVGPNGAGKTTLFNAISGLTSITSGTVSLFGEDVTKLPAHLRSRAGVSRSYQSIQLFPDLDVMDNVKLGLYNRQTTNLLGDVFRSPTQRREDKFATTEATELLAKVGLDGYARRSARRLSFGQGRRVELSRVMIGKPRLLLLDEPTTGVDAEQIGVLASVIKQIRATYDVTIIIVEHNLKFVRELCDEVIVMSSGRTIAQGPVNETLSRPEVVEAYLGGKAK